jgi:hypothetical protein
VESKAHIPARPAVQSNPLPDFPPLHETRYSRDQLLYALSNDAALPSGAIAVATFYAREIEPDIIAVVERASTEELDPPSARLLFRGLHILGGRRFTSVYRPLVALLRGPQDRVEHLLGDAITETLPKILAGVFDGDQAPLQALIADTTVDSFVRKAALKALAFLAFDGRLDRAGFQEFLRRFDKERLAPPDDDAMWHGWMAVVAVLGMVELVPQVRAAFADGRIAPDWCDEDDFDALLEAAVERPDDHTRLAAESMGYIDDVLVAFEPFHMSGDVFEDDDEMTDDDLLDWAASRVPARNPLRHVGRNDPCPCGSGKKAKKCCLH